MSRSPSAEDLAVLAFNVGSSSLSFKVYRHSDLLCRGKCHRVGVHGMEHSFVEVRTGELVQRVEAVFPDHLTAARHVLHLLREEGVSFDVVAHRFADGGGYFERGTVVAPETRALLDQCAPLAPLHNVAALAMIDLIQVEYPSVKQLVVFDSTFHAGLPDVARTYALPLTIARKYRKHGFHGLSYSDVLEKTTWYLGETKFKAVLLHLGTGGSSACAIVNGESVDTSMGYSPLQGLVMNTRCGDVDPGILTDLVREGYTGEDLLRMLHAESGLEGMSGGVSSDIRDLLKVEESSYDARLAIDLYVYRIVQYVGAYAAAMNGLDVLVFTDDVGLRVPEIRARICRSLGFLGGYIDATRNESADPERIEALHAEASRVRILAVPNDEERGMYAEVMELLS